MGLSGDSASGIRKIELLSEDPEQFLRVVFAQPKSLTAKVRNDFVRGLGKSNLDHMLVLASDFDTLEFVFLDKRKRDQKGPASGERIQVVPKTVSVNRRRTPTIGDGIDILISTDVLSEGQNLQDCGIIINYDLT